MDGINVSAHDLTEAHEALQQKLGQMRTAYINGRRWMGRETLAQVCDSLFNVVEALTQITSAMAMAATDDEEVKP
jgi:hypothetical protein